MALKKLTTGEMLSLTSPLTKEGADRTVLEGTTEVGGLLGRLDQAHSELRSASAATVNPAVADALAALTQRAKSADLRHDDVLRGIYYTLTGFAYLASSVDEREKLLALRDALLPLGLSTTQASYREEAGNAEVARAKVTGDAKHALERLPIPGGTLLDAAREWFRVGAQLGALEDERVTAMAGAGPSGDEAPAAQQKARNQWIRVLNAVRSNAAMVEEPSAALHALLQRFDDAERRAERRTTDASASETTAEPAPTAPAKS